MLFPRLLRATLLDLPVELSHTRQELIKVCRVLLEIC